MTKYNDVFDAYGAWLEALGIKRAGSYKSNLKTINRDVISKAVGNKDFLQELYDNVRNGGVSSLREITNMLKYIASVEKKTEMHNVTVEKNTYSDCRSALNQFIMFLNTQFVGMQPHKITTTKYPTDIKWEDENPRKALNIDGRLTTQDRLNQVEEKLNFPIRIITQIANNASTWADNIGLPQDHPARKLKQTMEDWLDELVNGIIFLIDCNKQVRLPYIEKIGFHEFEPGKKHVYVMLKESNEIDQVMTRKANGTITSMVLYNDEKYSHIAFDHVYRMEDILKDLKPAFPFLKELTDLIRQLNSGGIRSTETRQTVIAHIQKNFGIYAPKMQMLIDELNKLSRIISLEAIHKKDNLEKH